MGKTRKNPGDPPSLHQPKHGAASISDHNRNTVGAQRAASAASIADKGKPDESSKHRKGKVCLTFDDGPRIDGTFDVLEVLAAKRVSAVFFLTGKNMRGIKQADLVDRILSEGHTLGNHGYDHDPTGNVEYRAEMAKYGVTEVKKDFTKNEDYFIDLMKQNKKTPLNAFALARLPGDGKTHPRFVRMITEELKLIHIGWHFEFGKFKHLPSVSFENLKLAPNKASQATQPPDLSIILFHDANWELKGKILSAIIDKLREDHDIVSFGELKKYADNLFNESLRLDSSASQLDEQIAQLKLASESKDKKVDHTDEILALQAEAKRTRLQAENYRKGVKYFYKQVTLAVKN